MIQFSGALVLLDIEGTVSPIAYVHEVLFPYARAQAVAFLERRRAEPLVVEALQNIVAENQPDAATTVDTWSIAELVKLIKELMDRDAKQTGLKQLQGLIWEEGFTRGGLQSELFPDVAPALSAWVARGRQVRIFSSGSIQAQQLFFRYTAQGDLSHYLAGHHDTTTGPKRFAASYTAIASQAGVAPNQILYISDVTAELDAARAAGCLTALAMRPGNAPNPPHTHAVIHSFAKIEIA